MKVSEAMNSRQCVRAYTDQAVALEDVQELLELAGRAPSGSNLQPWKVHVVTGAAKQALIEAVYTRAAIQPGGDTPDIRMYPAGLQEPWRQRRGDCGELMYSRLGIARDDKAARFEQGARNMSFFGAPVGLIITMDRSLSESQIMDVGIFIQSFLLLASERGLSTCPQAFWQMWSDTIRENLGLARNEMIMVGMALGYADHSDAAADIRQPRQPLTDYATFRGFNNCEELA